jgi:hypothetical protein
MKLIRKIKYLLVIIALGFAGGCASADFSQGRQFNTAKVTEIVKGTTTRAEIIAWFGEPHAKAVGPDGEKWIYQYTKGTSSASGVFAISVKTTGTNNRLELSFDKDLVKEFNYTVGAL